MWIGSVSVGGIDSDVMARRIGHEIPLCRDSPFFQVRLQPVGIRENKIRDGLISPQPIRFRCARPIPQSPSLASMEKAGILPHRS